MRAEILLMGSGAGGRDLELCYGTGTLSFDESDL